MRHIGGESVSNNQWEYQWHVLRGLGNHDEEVVMSTILKK